MLQACDLVFAYDRTPVLQGVTLSVSPGEILALVGPNGSGKTTLLCLLRGLMRPQRGEVRWQGRSLAEFSARELAQQFGYVMQDPKIGFPMTVLEYVLQARFPYGRGFGFESEEDLRIAFWALDLTRTRQFTDRWIGELSGGERQRVVLARALAAEPRVLLLDEPTANLDLRFQVEMLALLRQLTRERALVTVFVAHELNLVAEFADRVLVLRAGRPIALGPPEAALREEILRAAFEADFLVDRNPMSGLPRITVSGQSAQEMISSQRRG